MAAVVYRRRENLLFSILTQIENHSHSYFTATIATTSSSNVDSALYLINTIDWDQQ